MKTVIALLLLSGLPFANTWASDWSGNLNFMLGGKHLEENDWEPLERHGEFGVLVDFKRREWPVSIAIDMLGSADEETILGVDLEARTSELDLGVRKVWEVPNQPIRPFIGGGVAFIGAELEGREGFVTVSDSDNGVGLWLAGGVYWTIGRHFNLGLELRHSRAEVTLYGVDVEAGGDHAGVLLGYHW